MSITTYSELQTAVTDRLARADFTTSQTKEAIALAESEMQRILDTLDMVTTNNAFSISAETVAVPTGLLEVQDFYLNTTPRYALLPKAAADITNLYTSGSAAPKFYAIQGSNFRFGPIPDGTYTATLTYLAKFTALSDSNTTNWLLTAHPDAYLYGSLKHGAIRLQDVQSVGYYDGLFQAALMAVNAQAQKAKWSGPGFASRADVVV